MTYRYSENEFNILLLHVINTKNFDYSYIIPFEELVLSDAEYKCVRGYFVEQDFLKKNVVTTDDTLIDVLSDKVFSMFYFKDEEHYNKFRSDFTKRFDCSFDEIFIDGLKPSIIYSDDYGIIVGLTHNT